MIIEYSYINSPRANLALSVDSRNTRESCTDPGHFASTLLIMWAASHMIFTVENSIIISCKVYLIWNIKGYLGLPVH